jgi:hypothetical protein
MRIALVQKAATGLVVFFVLMATGYPGRAAENINKNPTIQKCTKRFSGCINVCNHKFGTDRHDRGRSDCARSCEDKIFDCEAQPD